MTLIKSKYDYKEIKKKSVEGKRLYACPDGNAVASVTTILDATKDKTHLIAWRKRVGEQKAKEVVTEASGVGTRMHKYLEDYVESGDWKEPGSNPYARQAHSMAQQIKDKVMDHVEVWGSEVQLYHPKIYAGILNKRENKSHQKDLIKYKFKNIDLIIVNFYPFEETVKNTSNQKKIIENIDIGGPTLVRAAAKN